MRKDRNTTDAFGRPVDSRFDRYEEFEQETVGLPWTKRSYDKFFEGYSERKALVGKRARIVREYQGTLYRQELSNTKAKLIRILYAVLTVLAFALLITASCMNLRSNSCWYVVLFVYLSGIFYVRVFLALYTYILSARDMKIYEFVYGAMTLRRRTMLAACSIILPVVAAVLMLLAENQQFSGSEAVWILLLLLSAVSIGAIGAVESKVRYTEIDP